MRSSSFSRIVFIGDYVPRVCGIATFTADLRTAVDAGMPETECAVIAVTDLPEAYVYPDEVRFEIAEQNETSYLQAADYIDSTETDVVCLQHEFGIYGGTDGEHVLSLLERLRTPVVTTLHTVLEHPTADQRRVMNGIVRRSTRLVVMTGTGKRILTRVYGIPEERISVIPHGIPDMPFVDPAFYKDRFGVDGRRVILTFGLLSPNKGIEYVIRALPEIVSRYPDVAYIILGATHPNLVRSEGEAYRMKLHRLASELGVADHVIFKNRFVSTSELIEYLGAADIYITPYLNREQITSGTLSYAFGCGKAVVSTPYWHAEELLADECGVLVPFRDSGAIARELISLLEDEPRRNAMRKRAYIAGRDMTWQTVGELYREEFRIARAGRTGIGPGSGTPAIGAPNDESMHRRASRYPELNLRHLERLTDDTGIFQHAIFTMPNRFHGYCTDDVARALTLTVTLEKHGVESETIERLTRTYISFLHYAFDTENRLFHNFMSFDRRWLDEAGSDDCQGRAIQALGTVIRNTGRREYLLWAARLFSLALPSVSETPHPRAAAYALLGFCEYLSSFSGDRTVRAAAERLGSRLDSMYSASSSPDWRWFDDHLTYANAVVPHALIRTGVLLERKEYLEHGLESLSWLMKLQSAENGVFRPIGSDGFYPRGGRRAQWDQQPIEAHASTAACLAAYRVTGDRRWMAEAERAFAWFLGENDLCRPTADPETGGCFDALHPDRINLNRGAESTVLWLHALVLMRTAHDLPLAGGVRFGSQDGAGLLPAGKKFTVLPGVLESIGRGSSGHDRKRNGSAIELPHRAGLSEVGRLEEPGSSGIDGRTTDD